MTDAAVVSIVVPVLDEVAGTRRLLAAAAAWRSPWPFELLLVDGGSADGTAELLRAAERPWVRPIWLEPGAGLAAAWRAGLARARGTVLVTMDGDGVHGLEGVERLVAAVAGGADLAVARRYGPGGSGMPGRAWRERLASRLAARAWSARLGLPLRDPLHGFRARSARAHAALRARLAGVEGNLFLGWEAAWAVRLGQRVVEVPIPYGRRVGGAEKKRLLREGLRLARALARGGRGPDRAAGAPGPPAAPAALAVEAPAPSRLELRVLSRAAEVEAIRRGLLPFPRTAILYPVYGCNLACVGCEYAAENGRGYTLLPRARWTSLLDELAAGGTRGVELCGGGEPLLHPDATDAVLHGARAGLRFGVLTNGTALPARFLEEALVHCSYVRVSLDAATAATYAAVRPAPRAAPGEAPWERVLENVRRLVAARRPGTEVSLKFLVQRGNLGELAAAVALARTLGVDAIQFKALRAHPAALGDEEAAAAAAALAEARRAAAPFPVLGGPGKLGMRRACALTPLHTVVDARGDVFLCCYFTHRAARHRIGNVLDRPFGAVWGGARHRAAIEAIRPAECGVFDCRFVRYHEVLERWEGARAEDDAFL